METDELLIKTEGCQSSFHGTKVIGRVNSHRTVANWWNTWTCISEPQLKDMFKKIDIVMVSDYMEATGVTIVMFNSNNDIINLYLPKNSMCFGVRVALIQTKELFYYKIDPNVYTDFPMALSCWTAGWVAAYIYVDVADLHLNYGKWPHIRNWISENKNEDAGSHQKVWDLFTNKYLHLINDYSPVSAYIDAYEYCLNQIQATTKQLKNNAFTQKLSDVGEDVLKTLPFLKDSSEEDIARPDNHSQLFLNKVERAQLIIQDFAAYATQLEEEKVLLLFALDQECNFKTLLAEINQYINTELESYVDYRNLAFRIVSALEKKYDSSDLRVVQYSTTFLTAAPSKTPLTYQANEVHDSHLKKKLEKLAATKKKTTTIEDKFIKQAKAFTTGAGVLQWNVDDFIELETYHKNTVPTTYMTTNDDIKDRIERQLNFEKNGMFYCQEIGTDPLTRNGHSIEKIREYFENFRTDNGLVKEIIAEEMITIFKVLTYWNLQTELTSVHCKLRELAQYISLFGYTISNMPHCSWPETLPVFLNASTSTQVFTNQENVTDYVKGYKHFRKPNKLNWRYNIQELQPQSWNTVINEVVGTKLIKLWNDNVFTPWKEGETATKSAEENYAATVKHLLDFAKRSQLVIPTYKEIIKQCHTPDRGTDELQTWWNIVDSILIKEDYELFMEVSSVTNRDYFMKQVLDNKWDVQLKTSNNDSELEKNLALHLLKRAHDTTCKDILAAFNDKIAKKISDLKEGWLKSGEEIDLNEADFFDVEFTLKGSSHTVQFPCEYFNRISSELKRALTYIDRIYGTDAIRGELFSWFLKGYCRWCVTGHIEGQFSTTGGSIDAVLWERESAKQASFLFAVVTATVFDILSIPEACLNIVVENINETATLLIATFCRKYPILGRIQTGLLDWSGTSTEPRTSVDIFEQVVFHETVVTEKSNTVSESDTIQLTKTIMKFFSKSVNMSFLQKCLSGCMWTQDSPLLRIWKELQKNWIRSSERVFFEENNLKLNCIDFTGNIRKLEIDGESSSFAAFKRKYEQSHSKIVVTTFSKSGYERECNDHAPLPQSLSNMNLSEQIQSAINIPIPHNSPYFISQDRGRHVNEIPLQGPHYRSYPTFPSHLSKPPKPISTDTLTKKKTKQTAGVRIGDEGIFTGKKKSRKSAGNIRKVVGNPQRRRTWDELRGLEDNSPLKDNEESVSSGFTESIKELHLSEDNAQLRPILDYPRSSLEDFSGTADDSPVERYDDDDDDDNLKRDSMQSDDERSWRKPTRQRKPTGSGDWGEDSQQISDLIEGLNTVSLNNPQEQHVTDRQVLLFKSKDFRRQLAYLLELDRNIHG